jgi:predicted dienelactone hydrolase
MIISLIICFLSFKTIVAFPRFSFPEPGGEYSVGTRYFLFEDTERESVFTDHESGYYRITVQVWYPSEKADINPCYYQTKESAAAIASIFGMPGFILNYLSKINTNSFQDAIPHKADAPYPVIFYSPGGSGWINQASAVNEELASNGFVVISVGHESTEPFLRNENGDVITLDMYNEYASSINNELYSDQVENIKGIIIDCDNIEAKYELHQELNKAQPLNVNDVKERTGNIYYIINRLNEINKELSGIADTSSIGIFGFSKGGAVAGEVCVNDNPVRAGINLDGFMYGDIVEEPIDRPFMFIHSVSSDPEAYINDYFFHQSTEEAYMLKISGTTHANFGDLSLFDGVFKNRGVLGSIDGEKAIRIQRDYILAFFNKHLKNLNNHLLDNNEMGYDEVEFFKK